MKTFFTCHRWKNSVHQAGTRCLTEVMVPLPTRAEWVEYYGLQQLAGSKARQAAPQRHEHEQLQRRQNVCIDCLLFVPFKMRR